MTPLTLVDRRSDVAIRRFVERDIPQVAQMHARVWPNPTCTPEIYEEYFRRAFITNPGCDELLPSLVSEDGQGRIVGFIGVVSRRLELGTRVYRAAVPSQFIVDPARDAAYVGIRLLRTFLDGPQDVSIADEATDAGRGLWTGLGGVTAYLLSMYWTRLLQPGRFAASVLRKRKRWSTVAAAAAPCAAGADALLTRLSGTPFHQRRTAIRASELTSAFVVAHHAEFSPRPTLRIRHDEPSFQWLLDQTARMSVNGEPVISTVRRNGRLLGWYIAALDREGHCDVVHLEIGRRGAREVLEQLFQHAWQRDALAVTGRLDPRLMQALSDTCCVFHRRGPWMVVKTDRPDILREFESGHACFSRLDGEWPLRLVVPQPSGGIS